MPVQMLLADPAVRDFLTCPITLETPMVTITEEQSCEHARLGRDLYLLAGIRSPQFDGITKEASKPSRPTQAFLQLFLVLFPDIIGQSLTALAGRILTGI
jgi:hypothetical protein